MNISIVGTPLYMAPQILKNEVYTSKNDIWSLGIIFYEIVCGNTPWPCKNHIELLNKIYSCPISFPFPISEKLKDIIMKCLKIEENQRICWEDLFNNELFLGDNNKEENESQYNFISANDFKRNNSQV